MSSSATASPSPLKRMAAHEELNFLFTNYLPRRLATRFVGWLSEVEHPWVYRGAVALWRLFGTAPDLSDAAKQDFRSLKDLFTRELRSGARIFAGHRGGLCSPSDGIVGTFGTIEHGTLLQIKGQPYSLTELLQDATLASRFEGGHYVTLRLTAAMYHRFHAPADLCIDRVDYLQGDCWNVNPAALKRVPRLYCRNARAVLRTTLAEDGSPVLIVPVAAILVSGIRLHCLDTTFNQSRHGRGSYAPDQPLRRGDELGYFEHGSTVVMITPPDRAPSATLRGGAVVRAGEPIFEPPPESTQQEITDATP